MPMLQYGVSHTVQSLIVYERLWLLWWNPDTLIATSPGQCRLWVTIFISRNLDISSQAGAARPRSLALIS